MNDTNSMSVMMLTLYAAILTTMCKKIYLGGLYCYGVQTSTHITVILGNKESLVKRALNEG